MDFEIQVLPAPDHATVSVHPAPRKGEPLGHAALSWRCVPMKTKTLAPRPPWKTFEGCDEATQEAAGRYLQQAFRENLPATLITHISASGQMTTKPINLRAWAHTTTVLKRPGAKA